MRTGWNWTDPAGCSLNEASFLSPPPAGVPDALGELKWFLHAESALPMLMSFLLCERHVLDKPVLYLSPLFQAPSAELLRSSAGGARGTGVRGVAGVLPAGVLEVSLEASATARRIPCAARALEPDRGLEHLFAHPVVSVSEVRGLIGTTCPAANQRAERLTEIGVLGEITGQVRNRRFRHDPHIRLFTVEPAAERDD